MTGRRHYPHFRSHSGRVSVIKRVMAAKLILAAPMLLGCIGVRLA